jgi:hypothetical protein
MAACLTAVVYNNHAEFPVADEKLKVARVRLIDELDFRS